MRYRIFAQHAESSVDLGRLLRHAARSFEPDVRVHEELDTGELTAPFSAGVRGTLESARDGWIASFTLYVRHATVTDLVAAREAEAESDAFGMSLLAERCPTVWEIEPALDVKETATQLILALAASAALGPILSADGRELCGVRTALERAGVVVEHRSDR